jgi:D-threo-aldose 1-dehydrogenase
VATKVADLLPRLGLGCAPLGSLLGVVPEHDADETLRAALEGGIRYFDTAPLYGGGLSEERLGRAIAGRPDVLVSTKVGRLVRPNRPDAARPQGYEVGPERYVVDDHTYDGTMRSLEESLTRLGRDRIDVALVHDPEAVMETALGGAARALASLRDQGVIAAFGVGTNHNETAQTFVERADVDVVLIAGRYSLLDRSAAESLFPLCLERGVAVIVGGVYGSGVLADPEKRPFYRYQPVEPAVTDEVERMRVACAEHGVALPEAALAFATSHPAVTTAIVGARLPSEVDALLAATRSPVPHELLESL